MSTPNPFQEYLDSERAKDGAQADFIYGTGALKKNIEWGLPPEKANELLKLARETGAPIEHIRTDIEGFKKKLAVEGINYRVLRDEAPMVFRALNDRDTAPAIADSVDPLHKFTLAIDAYNKRADEALKNTVTDPASRAGAGFIAQAGGAKQYAGELGLRSVEQMKDVLGASGMFSEAFDSATRKLMERRIEQTETKARALADEGALQAEIASELREFYAPGEDVPPAQKFVGMAVESVVNMLPTLAAGVGGGAVAGMAGRAIGSSVGLTGMYTQVFGDKYQELRREGHAPAQASTHAHVYALTETIPETVPLGIALRGGRIGLENFVKRALETSGAEGAQEMITEILQMGYEAGVLDEHITLKEAVERVFTAGLLGAMVGGGMGLVGAASNMQQERSVYERFSAELDMQREDAMREASQATQRLEQLSTQRAQLEAGSPDADPNVLAELSASEEAARVELAEAQGRLQSIEARRVAGSTAVDIDALVDLTNAEIKVNNDKMRAERERMFADIEELVSRNMTYAQDQETLTELIDIAREAPLAQRDRELFTRLTDNDAKAYIDARDLKALFENEEKPMPLSLHNFLSSIPGGVYQLQEALALGRDLVLPLSPVVASMATTKGLDALQPLVRLSMGSVSPEKAQQEADLIAPLVERQAQSEERLRRLDDFSMRVNQEVRRTGASPQAARLYTQALRAFYETQSRRLAASPEALRVLDERMDGLSFMPINEARELERATGDVTYEQRAGADAPGVGVEEGNKQGVAPELRVKVPLRRMKLPPKPLFMLKTTNRNAQAMLNNLDHVLDKFPRAHESAEEWARMHAYAMATQDVVVPPYAFIRDINGDGAARKIASLSPGQLADANAGFAHGRAFRQMYLSGQVNVATTAKLFMWSFLSRSVPPYVQESLFIDAFNGIDKWIAMAAEGKLNEKTLKDYVAWASSVAPGGTGMPGSGTTHNLNAFGRSFLLKMSEQYKDGKSRLQYLHDMMSDPSYTGRQIRREFQLMGEGTGIDNKVVSFTLLVAGYTDVFVLDRVQLRQLWDDGRFTGQNLYDGRTVQLPNGERIYVEGSSIALSGLLNGVRGLLTYEAIERGIEARIQEVYAKVGRPQDASVGRYHWESWVAFSGQEASHGTIDAIMRDAAGDDAAIHRVVAKQGEYGTYDYGAQYGVDEQGESYIRYQLPSGQQMEFSIPAWRAFLAEIKPPRSAVVPSGFKVTGERDAEGNVIEPTEPWFNREGVDRQALENVAAKWADRQGPDTERARHVVAAAQAQVPDNAVTLAQGPSVGRVKLTHFSRTQGLDVLDPAYYGKGAAGAERERMRRDPDNWVNRTYYGIDVGKPGGYIKESMLGSVAYAAEVDSSELYDFSRDPDGLRERARAEEKGNPASIYERLIRDAGYSGYWVDRPGMGRVAAVFNSLPVRPAAIATSATEVFGTPVTVQRTVSAQNLFAKPEHFAKRYQLVSILKRDNWAILTPENPNNETLSPEENAKRVEQFKAELAQRGVDYQEVVGRYGGPDEHSFLVFTDLATSRELGAQYGQESILTRHGLVYHDGRVNKATGVTLHKQGEVSDFYSRIPALGDHPFTVDIDFENTTRLPEQLQNSTAPDAARTFNQSLPYTDSLGYYRQMHNVLADKLPGRASANEMANTVRAFVRKGMFKQDELEWSGLLEWLEGEQKVTRQEVLSFLARNELVVEEQVLEGEGAEIPEEVVEAAWRAEVEEAAAVEEDYLRREEYFYIQRTDSLDGIVEYDLMHTTSDALLFSYGSEEEAQEALDQEYRATALRNSMEDISFADVAERLREEAEVNDRGRPAEFFNWQAVKGGEKYTERLLIVGDTVDLFSSSQGTERVLTLRDEQFKGPHWKDYNVVAHLRTSDHETADGKRVLLVQEVQSDWHQKGREEGYKTTAEVKRVEAEAESLRAQAREVSELHIKAQSAYLDTVDRVRREIDAVDPDITDDELAFRTEEHEDVIAARAESNRLRDIHTQLRSDAIKLESSLVGLVPDAPFKNTWHMVAMKRALRIAAENGYDYIAWTTGEQNSKLYGLGRHIAQMDVLLRTDGKYDLSVTQSMTEEAPTTVGTGLDEAGLASYVGRGAAAAIVRRFNEGTEAEPVDGGELLTLYPKVDTELAEPVSRGMIAFYDERLPNEMQKYVKKWGGKVSDLKVQANDRMATVHGIAITDDMHESVMAGQPMFQKNRGQITFRRNSSVISVFEKGDPSTIIHEMGHFFLESMKAIASTGDAPQDFVNDYNTALRWMGNMGEPLTTEQHERFARGFEKYMWEGTSPSSALRRMFAVFSRWLRDVYLMVTQLNVELSDDVRKVFDRMIASQDAIDAQESTPLNAVDNNFMALLTKAEQESYMQRRAKAFDKAREKHMARALRQQKREQKEWWKTEREKHRADAEARANAMPVYQAWHRMATGEVLGAAANEGFNKDSIKLDRFEVAKRYGVEAAQALPRGTAVNRKGLDPDLVADHFGFSSGAALVHALTTHMPRKKYIEQLIDAAMVAEHGDLSARIQEAAQEEVARADRSGTVMYELQAIANKAGAPTATREFYEMQVDNIFATKSLAEVLDSRLYYAAEVAAARKVGTHLARKNYELAAAAKKEQLLNHIMYRKSVEAREMVEKAIRRFANYTRPQKRNKVRVDEAYHNMLVDLLAQYHMGPRPTGRTLEKVTAQAMEDWMRRREADDTAMFIPPPEVLNSQKTHYRDMTLNEFQSLVDVVENIYAQGRMLRRILVEGRRMELSAIGEEISTSVRSNLPAKKVPLQSRDPKEERKYAVENYFTMLLKARSIMKVLDGGELGPMYRYVLEAVDVAEVEKNRRLRKAAEDIEQLFEKHLGKDFRGLADYKNKVRLPEIDGELSRDGLIAVALNYGNIDSRIKLMEGEGWTEQQVLSLISRLTVREANLVNAIWSYLTDTYWEEIAALERRTTGLTPEKVEAAPFQITLASGETVEMNGGYYPMKYDERRDARAPDPAQMSIADAMRNSRFASAQTRNGHVQARVSGVRMKIRLDMQVLAQHVSEVIMDLTMREATWNAYKVLTVPEVQRAIVDTMGVNYYNALDLWIKDTAVGTVSTGGAFGAAVDGLRAGVSVGVMAFKMTTILAQITGLTHTVARLGSGNTARALWLATGGGDIRRMPDTVRRVYEKSEFMNQRSTTFHRDVMDALRTMERKGEIRGWLARTGFLPIVKMQAIVDTITWLGGYHEAIAKYGHENEEKLVRYADGVVIEAQGSGLSKDLSAIERGTLGGTIRLNALVRIFTTFYSYFNTKLNLAYVRTKHTNKRDPKQVAELAVDYALLFWVEAVVGAYLMGQGPDDDENWFWWNAKLLMSTVAGMFPGLREVAGSVQGFGGAPAGIRGFENMGQALSVVTRETVKFVDDGEFNAWAAARAVNAGAGTLFKFPYAQVNQVIRAMEDASKGNDIGFMDFVSYQEK